VTAARDVDDDTVTELVVVHVVADPKAELLGAARARRRLVVASQRRRNDRFAMRTEPAAATTGTTVAAAAAPAPRLLVRVRCDQLGGDLVEEPARRAVVGGAEHHATPRVTQIQPFLGAREADVAQPALLFE